LAATTLPDQAPKPVSGYPEADLARLRNEQALVDAAPPEIRAIIHEFGFGAVDLATLQRQRAAARKRERGSRDPRSRYVAPVIKMPD
jgi:hypothetical protein